MNTYEKEEIIGNWKEIVSNLEQIVDRIGFTEIMENNDSGCSQTIHAIIHINHARKELEQSIEILKGKYDK